MNCPMCGKEVADDAKFCPMCGASLDMFDTPVMPVVEKQQAPAEEKLKGYGKYDYKRKHPETLVEKEQPTVDPNADLQTQLAQKELIELNKNSQSKTKSGLITFVLLLITIAAFCVKAILPGIFFLIIMLVYANASVKRDERKEELEHLAKGEKIVNVCPRCKSDNIEMSMVQTSGMTTHGVSRVSDNINPLHPFTHTNVQKGNDYDFATYGNQCHCKNCGHVFSKPEVHYV